MITPEDMKKVNDYRMRILEASKEGKDIRTVVTKEELLWAVGKLAEQRRAASSATSTVAKGKSKKAPSGPELSVEDALKELGL